MLDPTYLLRAPSNESAEVAALRQAPSFAQIAADADERFAHLGFAAMMTCRPAAPQSGEAPSTCLERMLHEYCARIYREAAAVERRRQKSLPFLVQEVHRRWFGLDYRRKGPPYISCPLAVIAGHLSAKGEDP